VLAHKQQLVVQLRRVLIDEGSIFANDKNQYGVQFTGTKGTFKKSLPREIVSFAYTLKWYFINTIEQVCSLKKSAALRMLKRNEEPFKTLSMDDLFPSKPIFSKQRELKQPYRSCAVIASAGSLVDSQLGNFIGNFFQIIKSVEILLIFAIFRFSRRCS